MAAMIPPAIDRAEYAARQYTPEPKPTAGSDFPGCDGPRGRPRRGTHAGVGRGAHAGAEGIARQRTLLGWLAAQKFGPLTADRMAELLAGTEDPDRLAEAGDLIIACDDANDMLSRLS